MAGKKVYFTGNDERELEGLVERFNGRSPKYMCESVKSLPKKKDLCPIFRQRSIWPIFPISVNCGFFACESLLFLFIIVCFLFQTFPHRNCDSKFTWCRICLLGGYQWYRHASSFILGWFMNETWNGSFRLPRSDLICSFVNWLSKRVHAVTKMLKKFASYSSLM